MLRELVANLSFALQYLHKEDEVRFLSYFDPLTSLAKRGLFCERLVRTLEPRIGRRGTPAVAVLDIEQLSTINDSFGRHAGDPVAAAGRGPHEAPRRLHRVPRAFRRRHVRTDHGGGRGRGRGGALDAGAGGRGFPRAVQCGRPRHSGRCEVRIRALSGQRQRREHARAERGGRAAQREEHGREVSAASARALVRGGVAHDDGAPSARRGRSPGVRAALSAEDRHHDTADPRSGGAGAVARSGSGPRVAGRIPVADGNVGTHRAARRLDPAAGGLGPASLAGGGLSPGRVAVNISPVQLRRRAFADHLLDLVGEWRDDRPASISKSRKACSSTT